MAQEHRPADGGGRVVPAQEGPSSHMHVGARDDLRGAAAGVRGLRSTTSAAGCTSSRATARSSPSRRCETGRPLWVDDPSFNLEYHVRHTALPAPGLGGAAARAGRAHLLPAARPLQAAVGDVARSQGLEGDRFALISKTHHALVDGIAGVDLATGAVRPRPDAGRAPHEGEPWEPQPEPTRGRARRARRRAALVRTGLQAAARAVEALTPPGRGAAEARARRSRASARSPGPASTPRPTTPLNVRDRPAPALRVRAQRAARLQARQGRASAARSTTSCSTVVSRRAARVAAARAACAPRGSSCARSCRCRSAAEDERGQLGNRIAAMRGPLPVYVEDPVARLRVVAQGDGRAEGVQAGASAPRCSPACRTSRRRRSSRRRRG